MEISFDPAKNLSNIEERGLNFNMVAEFDFASALYRSDNRRDYGEHRWQALGLIGERLHALVFTPTPNGIRVISFRKANDREIRTYEKRA